MELWNAFLSVVMIGACAWVIGKICQVRMAHLETIVEDIEDGNIKKRNWHLHIPIAYALGIVCTLIIKFVLESPPSGFGLFLLATALGTWLCYVWEGIQGLRGANKTKADKFEMAKDIIVGGVFVALGSATTFLFL